MLGRRFLMIGRFVLDAEGMKPVEIDGANQGQIDHCFQDQARS